MVEAVPENEAVGISLWLVPAGDERALVERLIGELAAQLGTPVLAPHVTLLPGLRGREGDVVRRAKEMAATLEPHAIPLGPIEGRSEYFRCLYARVPETLRLLTTRAQARLTFRGSGEAAFEPHLSLVYGRLSPEAKEKLIVDLTPRLPPRLTCRALEVVRTKGPVADWQSLARFDLS
ncbi:MAG TPA: 2'-5' RNA ligase family protein [Vicinamibacteria bacterium]